MARLAVAAHARGIRLMGDLTTNHIGHTHEWFQAALADPNSPEAKFFFFTDHPHHYDTWWGLKEMPIIDHRSPELRRRFYDGPDSVVAKWLGPHALDAWRIDVANMTGIHGAINVSHEVATTIRRTMAQVTPESFLQAESNHDASRDLYGDGYQGTMNYAAFTRPLWQWLLSLQQRPYAHGKYPMVPNLPGGLIVGAMRELSGVTPWQATLHAMNLIGSHDTHRVASLLGDPRLVDVAFGMLAAYPGVPMIYAGDEIGLAAMGPEYARIPMPWAHPDRWDQRRLATTRALFGARAKSGALRRGGLRWLCISDDALAFLREAPRESVLVHAARADHTPIRIPAAVVGSELVGLAGTADLRADAGGMITLPADGPAFGMWEKVGIGTGRHRDGIRNARQLAACGMSQCWFPFSRTMFGRGWEQADDVCYAALPLSDMSGSIFPLRSTRQSSLRRVEGQSSAVDCHGWEITIRSRRPALINT